MSAAVSRVAAPVWLLLCLLLLSSPLQCSAHSYAVGMPIPMLKRSQYKGVSDSSSSQRFNLAPVVCNSLALDADMTCGVSVLSAPVPLWLE